MVVTLCAARFNIQKFYNMPVHCTYVFFVFLENKQRLFSVQYYVTGVLYLRRNVFIVLYQVNFKYVEFRVILGLKDLINFECHMSIYSRRKCRRY
jgi:hypothetical protein